MGLTKCYVVREVIWELKRLEGYGNVNVRLYGFYGVNRGLTPQLGMTNVVRG